jgi:hypothetical protein
MRQNATEKPLTAKQEKAVALLVDGKLSDEAIAKKLKVHRSTLDRWKRLPKFVAREQELRGRVREAITDASIAIKQNRVNSLADIHARMQRVIDARAKEHSKVPGGDTGLLVRSYKVIGTGPTAYEVEEYTVDTALLREMRETKKHIAIELGEWVEKHDVKTDSRKLLAEMLGVSPDVLPPDPDAK